MLASPVVCLAIIITGASITNVRYGAILRSDDGGAGAGAAGADDDADDDDADDDSAAVPYDADDHDNGDDARCINEPTSPVYASLTLKRVHEPSEEPGIIAALNSVRSIVAGFIICRLVLVSATIVFLDAFLPSFLPQKRLGRAVMLVSSGMPSAQMIIILLHKLDMCQYAAEFSFLFLFQYGASISTMTVLISVVLERVY